MVDIQNFVQIKIKSFNAFLKLLIIKENYFLKTSFALARNEFIDIKKRFLIAELCHKYLSK